LPDLGPGGILAQASAYEQALRTAKTRAGVRAAAEAGYWTGGNPPFGLRAVAIEGSRHKRLEINPDEAETIRLAVGWIVDEGLSTWDAAARLNALGRLTRTGVRWSHNRLRLMLVSSYLGGEWVWSKRQGYTAKGSTPPSSRRRRPEGEPVTVPVPAILEPERFGALQRALMEKNGAGRPRSDKRLAPLSGRLFGLCGSPFHGFAQAGRTPTYRCRNRKPELREQQCHDLSVNALDVEWTVWHEVTELLSRPDRLIAMAQRYLDTRGDQMAAEAAQAGDLDRRLAQAERERTNLIRAAAKVGPEAVEEAVRQVEAEITELRRMKAQVQAWVDANAATSSRRRRLWELADLAQSRLSHPTPSLMAQVFALLDIRVTILSYATRTEPVKVRVEGTVFDGLAGDLSEPVTPRTPLLGAPHLADDDAVRPHAQGVADQLAQGDLAAALDVGRPRLEPDDVRAGEVQLGGVLHYSLTTFTC
jgi:hypothetical protein